MKGWDSLYDKKGIIQKDPTQRVALAVDLFKKEGLISILDLGCGTGRHTQYLLKEGFDVYACDIAEHALSIIKKALPGVECRRCDMTLLPYEDASFDGILCNHVIQHGMLSDIKRAVSEMFRVLRRGGVLFLVAVSTQHPKALTGEEIEPNTRIHTDAMDGHIPHHFFTDMEMRGLFDAFDIIRLEHFKGASELEPEKGSAAWELYARKP